MHRIALCTLPVIAALLSAPNTAVADSVALGCQSNDPDRELERVADCMRMGRHVRVDANVSRGTATLGDGVSPAALGRDGAQDTGDVQRRIRVYSARPDAVWSGFFGQ